MKDIDRGLLLLFDFGIQQALLINLAKMTDANIPNLVPILEEVANAVLNRYIRVHPHLFTQECGPVKIFNTCGCGKCRGPAVAILNHHVKSLMIEAGFAEKGKLDLRGSHHGRCR